MANDKTANHFAPLRVANEGDGGVGEAVGTVPWGISSLTVDEGRAGGSADFLALGRIATAQPPNIAPTTAPSIPPHTNIAVS